MASSMDNTVTIGQKIDSAVAYVENLSDSGLYFVAFFFSVGFSYLVVNCGKGSRYPESQQLKSFDDNEKELKSMQEKKNKKKSYREPRWHIFKALNVFAGSTFLASVIHFIFNSEQYLTNTAEAHGNNKLMGLLALWSVYVLYFWGFFGVYFVDTDEGIETLDLVNDKGLRGTDTSSTAKNPSRVHPPADCTPVCSDRSLVKQPALKNTTSPVVLPTQTNDIIQLSNDELADLVLENKIKDHQLETKLNPTRAVSVRRLVFERKLSSLGKVKSLEELPYKHDLNYDRVFGANCEIVVGYVPLPVGIVGPCTLNGESVYIPMATTEGCLVASTNRGCKAITAGGGAVSTLLRDGITRAPCLRFESAAEAAALSLWVEESYNFEKLKAAFEKTTSFGKLLSVKPTVSGKNCYLRLKCFSGDAMGMNMISKGSLAVVELLRQHFPTLKLVALSGNMCTDKKAAATNWIDGRGKSVVVEATIPKSIVKSVLKTTVKAIVDTNLQKNLIGSAMSGTIGGFNAHASNIVTAVFLATGQDPAQNVESSNCLTILEETNEGDLWISCTMPSIEVGTVGGGTSLPAQAACLKAIGVKGGGDIPGGNARKLAHVVAVATMAGELSLLAALAANTLVQAHMQHNRKPQPSK